MLLPSESNDMGVLVLSIVLLVTGTFVYRTKTEAELRAQAGRSELSIEEWCRTIRTLAFGRAAVTTVVFFAAGYALWNSVPLGEGGSSDQVLAMFGWSIIVLTAFASTIAALRNAVMLSRIWVR